MKLKRKDHKGSNGRVLVVGGSKDYVGAPALAAMAALRTGVDIVTVCAPEKVAWAINSYTPDIITKKFLGDELNLTHTKEIVTLSERHDVVLIGNGLGQNKELVLRLLRDISKPLVLDADAVKVIPLDTVSNAILTPHTKEFEMLYGNTAKKFPYNDKDMDANIKNIMPFIGNNIILLKRPVDIIFSKEKKQLNRSGHNSMTVGGTGDILAGICAGYLAQGALPYEVAVHAAMVNGKLGEYMFKWKGYGYTAYDMVQELWRFTK
jgi:ADP-dependent NAD(P)H-hydrate dehydratase / NAD(P)H-hydrate epimerase